MIKQVIKFIFSFTIIFTVIGCVSQSAYVDKQTIEAHSDLEKIGAYKLQPLDPLFIRFSGVLDQIQLEPVIDENGQINLLHIDEPIKASGLTTSQLESKIETLKPQDAQMSLNRPA